MKFTAGMTLEGLIQCRLNGHPYTRPVRVTINREPWEHNNGTTTVLCGGDNGPVSVITDSIRVIETP